MRYGYSSDCTEHARATNFSAIQWNGLEGGSG